jgi:hypothetical protein
MTELKKFEKWAESEGILLERIEPGNQYYVYGSATLAWKAWQAALEANKPTIKPAESWTPQAYNEFNPFPK